DRPDGRQGLLRLGLAHPVPGQRGAGVRRPVGAPAHQRDAGVPQGHGPSRAGQGADAERAAQAPRRADRRHLLRASDVRAVLPDDGVRAGLGHRPPGLHPPSVPAAAAGQRAVLRRDDSAVGGVRRPQGPAHRDDRLDPGGDAVRRVLRTSVRGREPVGRVRVPEPGAGRDGADL
ncbi:hypothetical protein CATMIT_01601, partial [Catenibacterium mitsuokai DSM 15897]